MPGNGMPGNGIHTVDRADLIAVKHAAAVGWRFDLLAGRGADDGA